MELFYFFQFSVISGITEGSYIITFSAFNLLQYVVLFEVWKDNPASLRYIVGKVMNILIVIIDNCGYSSLILHQNLIRGSFLKINYNITLQTILMNLLNELFIFCFVSIYLFIVHSEWIFLLMHNFVSSFIDNFENIDSLSYTDFINDDTFYSIISTIISIKITTDLNKNIFVSETIRLLCVDSFPKFEFLLENLNFIIANKYCWLFSLTWQALLINFSRKYQDIFKSE